MQKWKKFLSVSVLLLAANLSAAQSKPETTPWVAPMPSQCVIHPPKPKKDIQCDIPMDCRVFNRTGIQCVWASTESLARKHKIEAASHLTDRYKSYSDANQLASVLTGLRVKFRMQYSENRDKTFLLDACARGWGAGVGLNGTHMVNIVHYKDGVVKIIDNLDPELRVQTWSEGRFLSRWDGWAVTLVPPGARF